MHELQKAVVMASFYGWQEVLSRLRSRATRVSLPCNPDKLDKKLNQKQGQVQKIKGDESKWLYSQKYLPDNGK